MSFINFKKKEVQIKIVYYGPGRGGKTTNLEYLNNNYRDKITSPMVSLQTYGDRTLFFDFLPIEVGRIKGYDVRLQLYTVPGQVKYNATRKLVLKGADGVVFVADSQAEQRRANVNALNQLYENCKMYDLNMFKMPLVIQYNKFDLGKEGIKLLPVETLRHDLNSRLKVPEFAASALHGKNVVATLRKIIALTIERVSKDLA